MTAGPASRRPRSPLLRFSWVPSNGRRPARPPFPVISYIQHLLPPALLSYFARAWYILTFRIAPNFLARQYGPIAAGLYAVLPSVAIGSITVIYLRLYFLPKDQSVPPRELPAELRERRVIFQCLAPGAEYDNHAERLDVFDDSGDGRRSRRRGDERTPRIERCYKGACRGRCKPARARHCSECGVCRMGFDHHCPLFANCLTAPYLPAFLALLLWTPPTVLLLSAPLYGPLCARAALAYSLRYTSDRVKGWYDWPLSWIVAGGPVGRYVGGVLLGWAELDSISDPTSVEMTTGLQWSTAVLVLIGQVLAAICAGLAWTAWTLMSTGSLTIDRERKRSFARALAAAAALQMSGMPLPADVRADLDRWGERRWFYVPLDPAMGLGDGEIIQSPLDEPVHNLGDKTNRELLLGSGWGWLLPWRAVRRGVEDEVLLNWPVREEAVVRFKEQAVKQARERLGMAEDEAGRATIHLDAT